MNIPHISCLDRLRIDLTSGDSTKILKPTMRASSGHIGQPTVTEISLNENGSLIMIHNVPLELTYARFHDCVTCLVIL